MRADRDWGWSIPLLVAGLLLALLSFGRLAVGLAAIGERQQVDYGEPIVYGQAARLVAGQPLYQPLDRQPFTVAAYTPVYYALGAGLQTVAGASFGPGRALSFAAGLVASMGIVWLAARQTRSIWAGLFAALVFVGLGFPGTVPWFALYRVDLLAEALSLSSIVLLAAGRSTPHLVLAGALAGLALLTKQSYIAAAVAGVIWLRSLEVRPTSRFSAQAAVGRASGVLLFGCTAAGLALVVAMAEELTTHAFVTNAVLANANPISLEQLTDLGLLFGETLGVPVVIAASFVALARPWQTATTRLLVMYWAASALQQVGLAKFGATYNYWIEFAAATAVLATLGLWSGATRQDQSPQTDALRRGRLLSRVMAVVFAVALAAAVPAAWATAASELTGSTTLTGVEPAGRADFQALVDLVRSEPGPVLGDPLDVVVLAGRSIVLEPVVFSILERHGQWDSTPLASQICAGQVPLLVLAFPIDLVGSYAPYGEPWWPPRIMRALQECMRPAGQRAGRYLYVPASSASASTQRSDRAVAQ